MKKSQKTLIIILTTIILSISSIVLIILFVIKINIKNISSSPKNNLENSNQNIQINNPTFSDTVIAITTDKPQKIFMLTIDRHDNSINKGQTEYYNYFDGYNWVKDEHTTIIQDFNISTNNRIKKYDIVWEKQTPYSFSSNIDINIFNSKFSLNLAELNSEINPRTNPIYNKSISETDAKIKIDDQTYDAKVVYIRLNSLNDNILYSAYDAKGITTNWAILFDKDNNFYYLDITKVEKPSKYYSDHKIAFMKYNDSKIEQIKDIDVTTIVNESNNQLMITDTYEFETHKTLDKIDIVVANSTDKNNSAFTWKHGLAEGIIVNKDATTKYLYGLSTYIKD